MADIEESGVIYVRLYSFPLKLYDVIELADPEIIHWVNNGEAFKVVDAEKFEHETLPKYYRHNKMSSFQRQLNSYGFKKMNINGESGAYYHPMFVRGKREQVKEIKYKRASKAAESKALLNKESDLVDDIVKHENMSENDTPVRITMSDDATLSEGEQEDEADMPSPSCGVKRVNSSASLHEPLENVSLSPLGSPMAIESHDNTNSNSDDESFDTLFDLDYTSEAGVRWMYDKLSISSYFTQQQQQYTYHYSCSATA